MFSRNGRKQSGSGGPSSSEAQSLDAANARQHGNNVDSSTMQSPPDLPPRRRSSVLPNQHSGRNLRMGSPWGLYIGKDSIGSNNMRKVAGSPSNHHLFCFCREGRWEHSSSAYCKGLHRQGQPRFQSNESNYSKISFAFTFIG